MDRGWSDGKGLDSGPLRAGFQGQILLPGNGAYEEARRVWNAIVDKRPAVIARCTSTADVASAVRFARDRDLEIGVRCGGHSITGLAVPEGGLMVDLSPMRSVRVDPSRRLALVQGGALLGSLDRATQVHGQATTAGNVSHTGVGGLTLGGGMGWLARRLGLACDNVTGFEVVTAEGSILRATETEHPDLWWALRGGGGNFGAVTEFEFRLHRIVESAMVIRCFHRLDQAPSVLRGWRELLASMPSEATPTAWVGTSVASPFLPPELHHRPLASVGYVWVGNRDQGRELLSPLRDLGPPVAERVEDLSYVELQAMDDESQRHGLRRYWKGHYLRELTDGAIEAFLSRGASPGGPEDSQFLPNGDLQGYGGAIATIDGEATAFSHRDALVEFIAAASWSEPAEDEVRVSAARRYGAAVEPFASGVYVNDLTDEGEGGVRRAYRPDKLARLGGIKARYDPDNVFHLNHNIRPGPGPS
jgi:FAD/FMN-containing dehydrogenase